MGMAASQARFLGLTARKTNVEYEGQQVNQQRTALASESAGLFNQMLELQVPTPPSATDYYNTRYVFESATSEDFSIVKYDPSTTSDLMYTLTLEYNEKVSKANSTYPILPGTAMTFDRTEISPATGDTPAKYSTVPKTVDYDGTTLPIVETTDADKTNIDLINEALGLTPEAAANTDYYKYTVNMGTADSPIDRTYYISSDDMDDLEMNEGSDVSYSGGLNQYYVGPANVTTTGQIDGYFEEGSDGRFLSVTFGSSTDEAFENIQGRTIDLDLTQVNDSEGYDEPIKDYEYQKMIYERAIQDINSQTEIIQQQDRTLELRLKQLDTEQEALKTEMDAVKEVISKNVESTFKTFA